MIGATERRLSALFQSAFSMSGIPCCVTGISFIFIAIGGFMKKSFYPLYGVKSAVLNANPDRGFRWEIAMDVESISHAGSYEEMKNAAEDRINSAVTDREMVKLAQLYLYLSGFQRP